MRAITLTLSLLLAAGVLHAQSIDRRVVSSAGGYGSTASVSVSSTVGEVAIATVTSGSFTITQGFQQPDGLFSNDVKSTASVVVGYELYPNPAQNSITLSLKTDNNALLHFSIYDAAGRLMHRQRNVTVEKQYKRSIDLAGYSSGNYLLHITDSQGTLAQTISFTKQ